MKMKMISSRGSIQSSIHVMTVSFIPRPPDLVAQACGQNQMHAVAHSICSWLLVFIVREAFSSQFPFSQRARSMNSVSFAMLRAKKTKIWQKFETLCHKICLVRFGVSCRCQESRRRTSNSFCVLLPCLALVQCLAGVAH